MEDEKLKINVIEFSPSVYIKGGLGKLKEEVLRSMKVPPMYRFVDFWEQKEVLLEWKFKFII